MLENIIKLFEDSNLAFLRDEANLILSGVSERCMCGALMTCIRYKLDETDFSDYHADIEYNRNFNRRIKTIIGDNQEVINITCDLIIHSRGEKPEQDNLLAIEMKRINHPEAEKTKDRNRLIALTRPTFDENVWTYDGVTLPRHVCGYILGVFYEINSKERQILMEYYINGELNNSKTIKF